MIDNSPSMMSMMENTLIDFLSFGLISLFFKLLLTLFFMLLSFLCVLNKGFLLYIVSSIDDDIIFRVTSSYLYNCYKKKQHGISVSSYAIMM